MMIKEEPVSPPVSPAPHVPSEEQSPKRRRHDEPITRLTLQQYLVPTRQNTSSRIIKAPSDSGAQCTNTPKPLFPDSPRAPSTGQIDLPARELPRTSHDALQESIITNRINTNDFGTLTSTPTEPTHNTIPLLFSPFHR